MGARSARPLRSQELIFLDADDDLATIRAKLESSPADEIFLVVPRRAASLRTPLEFRILARLAHELSSDLTIVSTDGRRRNIAHQEGLRTRRGYGGIRHLAEAAGAPRRWLPAAPDWLPLPSLATLLAFVVMLVIGGGLVLVALPEMRVSLAPRTENVQRDIELTVEPGQRTDTSKNLLAGELMRSDRLQVAGSVPATGQRNVGREPARGEVVFTNASASAVTLPAKTVVIARNSSRFLLDNEMRLPAYTYVGLRASVTAEQRGSQANVDANQVASLDPPVQGVTVANPRPMTGGTDRQVKAPTAADQQELRDQLMKRAREQLMAEFSSRGGAAKSVPPTTLQVRVESESYQPPVDSEGDQLNGTLTVSASVVAWDNQALNNLVRDILLAGFGPGYDLPMTLLRLQPPEVVETQNQRMRVKVRAEAVVVYRLDGDAIARDLTGKSAEEARAMLRQVDGLANPARVEMAPSWAPRAWRIEVAIAGVK